MLQVKVTLWTKEEDVEEEEERGGRDEKKVGSLHINSGTAHSPCLACLTRRGAVERVFSHMPHS
jgi:hypothetical protein